MSNEFIKTPCILCKGEAKTKEIDHGNFSVFICSNPDCGNIEISISAQELLEYKPDLKNLLKNKAKKCKSEGDILKINLDSNKKIQSKSIPKK